MNDMNNRNSGVYGPTNRIDDNLNNQNGYYNNMNNGNNMNNSNNMAHFNNMENPPKKKGNGCLVFFLILILMAVAGFGGWKLGTMYANSEDKLSSNQENNDADSKEEVNSKDEIYNPIKNNNYTFKAEREINITLNDDKVNAVAYYYVDYETLSSGDDNVSKYIIRREIFAEDKKVTDALVIGAVDIEKDVDAYIKNDNLNNSNILKDSINDNEYFVLFLEDNRYLVDDGVLSPSYIDTKNINAYIIADDGSLLKTINSYDGELSLIAIFVDKNNIGDRKSYKYEEIEAYKDSNKDNFDFDIEVDYAVYANNNKLDIHDNFIYYVSKEDCQRFKELKLTIKSGVVSEEHIQTFDGDMVQTSGAC